MSLDMLTSPRVNTARSQPHIAVRWKKKIHVTVSVV